MKSITLFFSAIIILTIQGWSQEIMVAGWTFPGSSAAADTGLIDNIDREITTVGGTSGIDFKNGFETKAAQVTQWNNGTDQKAWVVNLSALGTMNLTISSRQQSGGEDPGPKYYKLQYSIDDGTSWNDIDDGDIEVENDWESSFLNQLPLPEECDNAENLMVRWLMTSEEASGSGGNVPETGKSKIDNIFIRGELINDIALSSVPEFRILSATHQNLLTIQSESIIESVDIISLEGRSWNFSHLNSQEVKIQVPAILSGKMVICRIKWEKNPLIYSQKVFLH